MQLLSNAKTYDWATWLIGIMRSIIAGGATGILNTTGTALVLPGEVNTGAGLGKLLTLLGVYFILGSIVHLAIFLSTHGAPDQLQVALEHADAAQREANTAIQKAKQSSTEIPENMNLEALMMGVMSALLSVIAFLIVIIYRNVVKQLVILDKKASASLLTLIVLVGEMKVASPELMKSLQEALHFVQTL